MHAPGPPLTARLAERLDRRLLPSAPWLGLLTLSFASLASALYLGFSDASVQDYIAQNELAPAHRQALLLWLVVACGLAGLASLSLWMKRTRHAEVNGRGVHALARLGMRRPDRVSDAGGWSG